MTTFGGATIPPIFGGGSSAPTMGYSFTAASAALVTPDSQALTQAQRTITAPARSVGDLLMLLSVSYGAYPTPRTPTFAIWATKNGTQFAANSVNCLISIRIATGDAQDDCFVGSLGHVGNIAQVLSFNLHPYAAAGQPFVVGDSKSAAADTTLPHPQSRALGNLWTVRGFISGKRMQAAQTGFTPGATGDGITQTLGANTGVSPFNDGLLAAIGYKLVEDGSDDPSAGVWSLPAYSNGTAALAGTFKSADS